MDLYAENILDHFRHPHRKAALTRHSVELQEKNPSCGDSLTLMLRMKKNTIEDVGWEGEGCAISQASMSILADALIGKTIEAAQALSPKDILAMLGVEVGPRRLKCALLSLHALRNALRKFQNLPPTPWREVLPNA